MIRHLIITEIKDKVKFIVAIRKLLPDLTLLQASNIRFSLPFKEFNCEFDRELVHILLNGICYFSYLSDAEIYYQDAHQWYESITSFEKNQVDDLCLMAAGEKPKDHRMAKFWFSHLTESNKSKVNTLCLAGSVLS